MLFAIFIYLLVAISLNLAVFLIAATDANFAKHNPYYELNPGSRYRKHIVMSWVWPIAFCYFVLTNIVSAVKLILS